MIERFRNGIKKPSKIAVSIFPFAYIFLNPNASGALRKVSETIINASVL